MNDPRTDAGGGAATEQMPDMDATADTEPLVESDLLVEEISIDGMCGVY